MGANRRELIRNLLLNSQTPVKAAELAKAAGVSRQVIVQDIALLRAQKEPIMATPQGYVVLPRPDSPGISRIITSRHRAEDTEQELNILVDHGVHVVDVGIEHPVYGKIFRPLGLKTRVDVKNFIRRMAANDASLLCSLTDGVHLHTIEAETPQQMEDAVTELVRLGFMLQECISTPTSGEDSGK